MTNEEPTSPANPPAGELLSRNGFVARRYRPEDRQAVRDICAATCWMGQPCPGLTPDDWVWAEVWTRYHTDVRPELAYVIERSTGILPVSTSAVSPTCCENRGQAPFSPNGNDGEKGASPHFRVVGYLTGTPDQREADRYVLRLLPGIVMHIIRAKLMRQSQPRRACMSFLRTLLSGELACPKAILRDYPATMHVNLLPEARGCGLGGAMVELLMADLRALGVRGLHGEPLSINAAVAKMHARMGFRLVHGRPTRAFWHVTRRKIEIQTWVRDL